MEYGEYFYMVYVDGQQGPTYKHPDRLSAEKEAERLARLPDIQGKKVYILNVQGCCQYQSVNWLPFKKDELTF